LCAHHDKNIALRLSLSVREKYFLFSCIFPLACLFDSLVRVSRRVKAPHLTWPNIEHHGKVTKRLLFSLTKKVRSHFTSAHFTTPQSCCCQFLLPARLNNLTPAGYGGKGWFWPMKWRYFPYFVATSGSMSLSFQSAFQTFAYATCSLSVFPLYI